MHRVNKNYYLRIYKNTKTFRQVAVMDTARITISSQKETV